MIKKQSPPVVRVLIIVALVACLAALVALATGCSQGITANGRQVDQGQLNAEVARRLSVMKKSSPADLLGKRGQRLADQTRRQVATEMIKATLIDEQAAQLGVKLPPDEVNRRLDAEKAAVGAKRFAADLKKQKLTEDQYKVKLHNEALVDAVAAKVTSNVVVSEDEAETFYLTHRNLYARSEMAHMLQILLDTEGEAKIALGQLNSGADFRTLATNISRDHSSWLNGGDMGWIERGTMDPAFEEKAFAVPTGGTSDIIQAADGYHIVKVIDRREAYTPTFNDVKARASEDALNAKKDEVFSDWLRTLYANAMVQMPSSLGAWDPALGGVAVKSGGGS
jgi:foldase protein PrsA